MRVGDRLEGGLVCFLGTEHGRLSGGETEVWDGIPGQDEGWVLGEIGCICWWLRTRALLWSYSILWQLLSHWKAGKSSSGCT